MRAPLAGRGGGGDREVLWGSGSGCNTLGWGDAAGRRACSAGPRRAVGEGGAGRGITPWVPPRGEGRLAVWPALRCLSLGISVSMVERVTTLTAAVCHVLTDVSH